MFAYELVFPVLFQFFASQTPAGVSMNPDIQKYLDFVLKMIIAFGIVFLFGIVALFVAIPNSNIIYCVLMLLIFGGFTAFPEFAPDGKTIVFASDKGAKTPYEFNIFTAEWK